MKNKIIKIPDMKTIYKCLEHNKKLKSYKKRKK